MSQNLPERSLRDFMSLRHPNHLRPQVQMVQLQLQVEVEVEVEPFRTYGRKHYLPTPRGPCSSKSRFFLY